MGSAHERCFGDVFDVSYGYTRSVDASGELQRNLELGRRNLKSCWATWVADALGLTPVSRVCLNWAAPAFFQDCCEIRWMPERDIIVARFVCMDFIR